MTPTMCKSVLSMTMRTIRAHGYDITLLQIAEFLENDCYADAAKDLRDFVEKHRIVLRRG